MVFNKTSTKPSSTSCSRQRCYVIHAMTIYIHRHVIDKRDWAIGSQDFFLRTIGKTMTSVSTTRATARMTKHMHFFFLAADYNKYKIHFITVKPPEERGMCRHWSQTEAGNCTSLIAIGPTETTVKSITTVSYLVCCCLGQLHIAHFYMHVRTLHVRFNAIYNH